MQAAKTEQAQRGMPLWAKWAAVVALAALVIYGARLIDPLIGQKIVRWVQQSETQRANWTAWTGANCSVRGNKIIPGDWLTSDREVTVYGCGDGATYEAMQGGVPQAWIEAHPAEANKPRR